MRSKAFERYAWFFLAYLIAVIVFGAWVRISHSGAGCGNHWPTCNGQIVPFDAGTQTLIEFSHRLTSGLCGVLGLVLVGWAWRLFGFGKVTGAAVLTLMFIVFEAAIGAGLVLGELVADNDSAARAIVVALHLSNTLMLTGCAASTAWVAGGRPLPPLGAVMRSRYGIALGLLILTAMTGAVTALGDTLFPIEPTLGPGMFDRVRDDLGAANHFLVRLRVLHPAVAVVTALALLAILAPRAFGVERKGWSRAALAAVVAETSLGFLNVVLAAPGWLQLVHLFTAQALWVLVLLSSYDACGAAETAPVARASGLVGVAGAGRTG